jgi:hypothetical protein
LKPRTPGFRNWSPDPHAVAPALDNQMLKELLEQKW